MSETVREFIGVKNVTFTPDGGDPIAFPIQDDDGVEHASIVDDIRHGSASGKYVNFVHTTRIVDEVTVRTKDFAVLDDPGLAVGTLGTLAWTLIGCGLADGSDKTCSAPAKVVSRVPWSATDGASAAQGEVAFLLLSPDGTSDPLTVS